MSSQDPERQSLKTGAGSLSKGSQPPAKTQMRGLKGMLQNEENKIVLLTLGGVFLGVVAGFLLRRFCDYDEPRDKAFVLLCVKVLGDLMMRAFKLIIIPLLVTSIITGITALGSSSGRIGKLAFIYYLITTVIAIVVGISLVLVINPGKMNDDSEVSAAVNVTMVNNTSKSLEVRNLEPKKFEAPITAIQFIDIAKSLLPDNIFYATVALDVTKPHEDYTDVNENFEGKKVFVKQRRLGSANILGLVAVSILVAMILNQLNGDDKKVENLLQLIVEVNEVVMFCIGKIILLVPVGVASLIAGCIYEMEGDVSVTLKKMAWYNATVLIGLFIHWLIILPLIYYLMVRKNPYSYMFGLKKAIITAFGTASSSAALPFNMECCENLGIEKRLTNFILPLGCTVNMDGTALLEGVAAITIAQMEGMDLSAAQIVTLLITATLCSIGASSIPSAGLIMLTIILEGMGLSTKNIALLWASDWLLDRFRTMINITGDAIGCAVVAQLEQKR